MSIQSPMPTVRRSFVIVALALLLAACGSAVPSPRPVTDGPMIELRDDRFHPALLEVPAGTTVTWWWNDATFGGHDLVSDAFSVPEQTSGTFADRFDTPGTFTYKCTLHNGMTGTIVVKAAAASAGK